MLKLAKIYIYVVVRRSAAIPAPVFGDRTLIPVTVRHAKVFLAHHDLPDR